MITYADKMMRPKPHMMVEVSCGAPKLLVLCGSEYALKKLCKDAWGEGHLIKTDDHEYEWRLDNG